MIHIYKGPVYHYIGDHIVHGMSSMQTFKDAQIFDSFLCKHTEISHKNISFLSN